jgi:helicase
MLVDSGGFASLFERARVVEINGLGAIEINVEEEVDRIEPREVLEFQERVADVAFTLDFPIPPGMEREEAERRLDLTIRNALWAAENRRRRDLPLYAVVQGLELEDYVRCADAFRTVRFDGIAIGGLVPRIRNERLIFDLISAVRAVQPMLPLHVFGLGKPSLVARLFKAGVDSVDSSAYVKLAAEGKIWGQEAAPPGALAPLDRMKIAILNLAIATGTGLPLSAHKLLGGSLMASAQETE